MEFISAEEFLKQPKEVQNVFLDWWKCDLGDLCISNEEYEKDKIYYNVICMNIELESNIEGDWEYFKTVATPLLTEGQLRQFIEDKTGCKINIEHYNKNDILLRFYKNEKEIRSHMFYDIGNLLQAYWIEAIKIAKEG